MFSGPPFPTVLTALGQYKVTVLFAHWRSSEFYEEDVNWETLSERFRNWGSWGSEIGLNGVANNLLIHDFPEDKIAVLADLNRAVSQAYPFESRQKEPRIRLAPTREHQMYYRRKALDARLPGCFRNGASVEFANGLMMIEAFAAALTSTYVSLIDLSVCNSILLGEMIKARAPNCLAIGTELPAIVEFRLMFYECLFGLLRDGRSYLDTATKLRQELVRSLKREKK